jgi:hypothetical protein
MQQKTQRIAIKIALALATLGLGWFIARRVAATHATGWIIAGWCLSAFVGLRMAVKVWRNARAMRAHTAAHGINLKSVDTATTAAMPAWARGYYAMEKRAYRYCWRAITGTPLAPAGPFSVANGALGGRRTLSLLLTLALCGGAIAYCLPRYFAPVWPLLGAGVALAALVLYALVWIVGERRSLREAGHAITGGMLTIDLGLRASASIELTSLISCVAIGGRTQRGQTWRFTPGEKATVSLDVSQPFPAIIRGTPQQIPAGRVMLYVDDPASFVGAVNRAIAASRLSA